MRKHDTSEFSDQRETLLGDQLMPEPTKDTLDYVLQVSEALPINDEWQI